MKREIHTFVHECDTCLCNKGETGKISGTLQPIPIPPSIWMDIYIYFIVKLPKSGNKSFIMVVVDLLSKYSHLHALQHLFIAFVVAQIFMDNILKLDGIPHSIVFDCDPTFTNKFCQELIKLHGTQLHLITTYHPHTNGQNEVVKKCLETQGCLD
jgi:hypothetical protein